MSINYFMAYIACQRIKGIDYYYIVENIQVGSHERKQARKYLGNKKPTTDEARKMIREFESKMDEVRKKILGHYYISHPDIEAVDSITKLFWDRYISLNPTE